MRRSGRDHCGHLRQVPDPRPSPLHRGRVADRANSLQEKEDAMTAYTDITAETESHVCVVTIRKPPFNYLRQFPDPPDRRRVRSRRPRSEHSRHRARRRRQGVLRRRRSRQPLRHRHGRRRRPASLQGGRASVSRAKSRSSPRCMARRSAAASASPSWPTFASPARKRASRPISRVSACTAASASRPRCRASSASSRPRCCSTRAAASPARRPIASASPTCSCPNTRC